MTLRKNKIKDTIKVIKALDNKEFYWKELIKRLLIKKEDSLVMLLVH